MKVKSLILLFLNAFILFVITFILWRSFFSLIFFIIPFIYILISVRKKHA